MLYNKKLPFAIFSKKKKSLKFNKQIRIKNDLSCTIVKNHPIGKAHAKSTRAKLHTNLTTTSSPERSSEERLEGWSFLARSNQISSSNFSPSSHYHDRGSCRMIGDAIFELLDHRDSMDSHLRDTSINRSLVSFFFFFFSLCVHVCWTYTRMFLLQGNVGERKERRWVLLSPVSREQGM